jgi:hypothetical protein
VPDRVPAKRVEGEATPNMEKEQRSLAESRSLWLSLAAAVAVVVLGLLGVYQATRAPDLSHQRPAGAYLLAMRATGGLRGATLRGASLAGTDLRETRLDNADLQGADLTHADLREASLLGADLTGARLAGTRLEGARYDAATRWPAGCDPLTRGAVLYGPDRAP